VEEQTLLQWKSKHSCSGRVNTFAVEEQTLLQWKSKHFCSGRANTLAVEEQTLLQCKSKHDLDFGQAPDPRRRLTTYRPCRPRRRLTTYRPCRMRKKNGTKRKKKTARIPINDIYQNERRYIPHGLKPDPRRLGDLMREKKRKQREKKDRTNSNKRYIYRTASSRIRAASAISANRLRACR